MAYSPKPHAEIVSNIIAYLNASGSRITNFNPGSDIRTLIEAIALEVSRIMSEFHLSYMEAIREACYWAFGFGLKTGRLATGNLRIEKSGHTEPVIIPAFTITLGGLTWITEPTPPVISVDTTYADLEIKAEAAGTEYNLIEVGVIDTREGQGDISEEFDFDRVYNFTPITGGTDSESESQREARWQDFIQNLGKQTKAGIRAILLNIPGVLDVFVDDNKNPLTLKEEMGWVLVYISDGSSSPPQALLDEVEKVLTGDPDDESNYPGLIAAGTRGWVEAINVIPISIDYSLNLLNVSQLSDVQAIEIASSAIQDYVNRLAAGNDVLLDIVKSRALEARRTEFIGISINSPVTNIVIPAGSLPKVGGAGGGTVTCSDVTRNIFP